MRSLSIVAGLRNISIIPYLFDIAGQVLVFGGD